MDLNRFSHARKTKQPHHSQSDEVGHHFNNYPSKQKQSRLVGPVLHAPTTFILENLLNEKLESRRVLLVDLQVMMIRFLEQATLF